MSVSATPVTRQPAPTHRLAALVGLLHPGPSAATVLAVGGFTAILAGGRPPLDRLALLLLAVALQQAAVSLHNDWSDRALDAAAKPWRAIPSGLVAAPVVRALAWLLAGASVVTAALLGWETVALDVLGIAAGFVYNARLKRTPWSWLPFAVAFPTLPLFGAAALDAWPPIWWTVFVAGLPTVLTIHLADSLPDLAADAAGGVHGLAQRLGPRRALRVSLVALALSGGAALTAGSLARSASAAAGGLTGLACLAVACRWPRAHRVAVTAGAAAAALGWIAMLARAAG